MAATVSVARDARETAEREVDAGLLATESSPPERFPAAGLHWLKGLLLLARGRDDDALEECDRELALEARDLLYTRECCANTWYAIGACRLRQGDAAEARTAFEEAIRRVPGHLMARAGLSVLGHAAKPDRAAPNANAVDVALARAVSLVANGDATGAARLVDAALAAAPRGHAGWLIPVEPLLHVQRDRGTWTAVLARLRTRAS